jgi:hypothetical protein
MRKRRRTSTTSFSSPKSKPWIILIAGFILYFATILVKGGFKTNSKMILIDISIFLTGSFLWLLFFSQFTLPTRKLQDRFLAFDRLIRHIFNRHGPAIFIENGEIKKEITLTGGRTTPSSDNIAKQGPGVVILDTASAGLLRTATEFTRAVGPGVVFTQSDPINPKGKSEYVGGTISLHTQNTHLGPRENENPFAPAEAYENIEAYEHAQQRRQAVRGFTRDGIEIIPSISVTFRLDTKPSEGYTALGYDPDKTQKAIIGRPVNSNMPVGTPEHLTEWYHLPAYLAADIWRENIAKFTLMELFPTSIENESALQFLLDHIRTRLQKPIYEELDAFGKPSKSMKASREYKMINDRGLVILGVRIGALHLPKSVEEQMIRRWSGSWLMQARLDKQSVEKIRFQAQERGKQTAICEYIDAITRQIGMLSADHQLDGREIIRYFVNGTLKLISRDPQLSAMSKDEIDLLNKILIWTELENNH